MAIATTPSQYKFPETAIQYYQNLIHDLDLELRPEWLADQVQDLEKDNQTIDCRLVGIHAQLATRHEALEYKG